MQVNLMPDPAKLFDQFHNQLQHMDGPAAQKASTPNDESLTRSIIFDITMCLNTCVGSYDDEQGQTHPIADWERLNQLITTVNELLHTLAQHHDRRCNCEHARDLCAVEKCVITCHSCGQRIDDYEYHELPTSDTIRLRQLQERENDA